jgi:integrase
MDAKNLQMKELLERQELELLKCLAVVREQMAEINGNRKQFRLYKPAYVKSGVYYAHLFDDNGVQTDARMSCLTTDKETAYQYALEHRESFLKNYFDKKQKGDFYKLLAEYYMAENKLFVRSKRDIRDNQIKKYQSFINNYFIPFLQKNKITNIKDVSLEIIENFQLYCQDITLNGNFSLSAKTINNNISCAIAPIFNQVLKEKSLFKTEKIALPITDKKKIGVIPIRTTFSILFNDNLWGDWTDTNNPTEIPYLTHKIRNIERYRLYCLLGNLCGLRDAEIYMLRRENITLIGKTHFLNIENSRIDKSGTKTPAGKRFVPLHPFAYNKLIQYINANKRNDYIFYNGNEVIGYNDFSRAKDIFALMCGYDYESIKEHNIVFYSFRHFWKTMINNAINDINLVEYYMGHTNKADIQKNYLHIGSIGNPYIESNGKIIIKAIDDYFSELFRKVIRREGEKETTEFISTLQEPELKRIMYKDVSKKDGKDYLIWVIPNPETIEDVFEEEQEENIIEKMNNNL